MVLLEVGLGGRFDATNVIERPALSVITPVSMDHMHYLGDTLRTLDGRDPHHGPTLLYSLGNEHLMIGYAGDLGQMGNAEHLSAARDLHKLPGN